MLGPEENLGERFQTYWERNCQYRVDNPQSAIQTDRILKVGVFCHGRGDRGSSCRRLVDEGDSRKHFGERDERRGNIKAVSCAQRVASDRPAPSLCATRDQVG